MSAKTDLQNLLDQMTDEEAAAILEYALVLLEERARPEPQERDDAASPAGPTDESQPFAHPSA